MDEKDTLWNRCFWEVVKRCQAEGKTEVVFSDVDALVVEISKGITEYNSWPSFPAQKSKEGV